LSLSGTARRRITRELPLEHALNLLTEGDLQLEGRLVDASNTTLRALVTLDGVTARCVYKPIRGERPLWDFPDGTLAGREVAAYLVSEATGWNVVPPTVMRDGPLGEGACQLWIDETRDEAAIRVGFVRADELPPGWLTVAAAEDDDGEAYLLAHADDDELSRMAVFDAVINNADRKGGHLLPAADGHLYAIDHGVTFNTENKLRTLLWGWAGEPLTDEAVEVLGKLSAELADGGLGARLAELITAAELDALRARVAALLGTGRHPEPSGEWPAIPWPPI
jgi:uncharacterized repeat protein (TIGR03843 family)